MDSKKPNKITEIVKLHQMIKKWKKLAVSSAPKASNSKSIKFLKRTLSISEASSATASPVSDDVPKGYLAVCVGDEMRRFVIPTEYLTYRAFAELLQEAEEEFGFRHEGVLRFPCDVDAFESILKQVEKKSSAAAPPPPNCSSESEFAKSSRRKISGEMKYI